MTSSGHPDLEQLAALTAGGLPADDRAAVAAHIDGCAMCRVAALRLRDVAVPKPDAAQIAALVAAMPPVPSGLVEALATPQRPAAARVGELWRAGVATGELVWVRSVVGDVLAVLPVTLDVEFADDDTLLVAPEDNPLGLEMAVFTALEAHLDPRTLLHRYGTLNIAAAVQEVRSARRGRRPATVAVGAPIRSAEDQRLEYRRGLADRLAALSPESLYDEPADEASADGAVDLLGVADQLDRLGLQRSCRHEPLAGDPMFVSQDHHLLPVALVIDLDAVVLVAVLVGPAARTELTSVDIAGACGLLRRLYPEVDDVAVTVADQEWSTVVVSGADTTEAVEAPHGRTVGPRAPTGVTNLVDALHKHFDGRAPSPFDDDEPVELHAAGRIDLQELTGRAAMTAVMAVAAEGARAQGVRRLGYSELSHPLAYKRIAVLVSRLVAGSDPALAVAALMEEADQ